MRLAGERAERNHGTDGFRVLCRQFFPSSLPRQEACITRCNVCWLRRKELREALLLWCSNSGGQGQSSRRMVFPLPSGRRCCIVWWSRRNRFAPWQQRMVSPRKRSVAFFILSSSMDSGKLSRTQAGLRPSEQQALFLLSMQGSVCSPIRSAPVLPAGVESEGREPPACPPRESRPHER